MNTITVTDGVATIKAKRKGIFYDVLIDAVDLPLAENRHWGIDAKGYAVSMDKDRKISKLHRLICPSEKPLVTDHINCNKRDNRRGNLRATTTIMNARNRGDWDGKTWGSSYIRFKGNRWMVQFDVGDRPRGFGGFATKEEAEARAKEIYEARRRGENPMFNVRKLASSGKMGINWNTHRRKWTTYAYINGKKTYLGLFADLEEAKREVAKVETHA